MCICLCVRPSALLFFCVFVGSFARVRVPFSSFVCSFFPFLFTDRLIKCRFGPSEIYLNLGDITSILFEYIDSCS